MLKEKPKKFFSPMCNFRIPLSVVWKLSEKRPAEFQTRAAIHSSIYHGTR